MMRALSRPVRILIEALLIGGLVVLFIVILDPERLQEDFSRVTLVSILGLIAFQFGIHTFGMLQWLVLLREAGIRAFAFALLGLGSNRSLVFSVILRIGQLVMVALGLADLVASRLMKKVVREGVEGADRIRTGA